tara:strand:+ start:706 stop:1101 length:396 start_codon:yes stop_codon:yes gene_type:complete
MPDEYGRKTDKEKVLDRYPKAKSVKKVEERETLGGFPKRIIIRKTEGFEVTAGDHISFRPSAKDSWSSVLRSIEAEETENERVKKVQEMLNDFEYFRKNHFPNLQEFKISDDQRKNIDFLIWEYLNKEFNK